MISAGLTIYAAHRLETLAARLADEMKADPLDPLEREVIVVQSRGMYRWLTLELAKRLGIAATIATPFPGTFCRALAERIAGANDIPPSERYEPSGRSAFERDALAWRIFHLLAAGPKAVTRPAAAYTKDDPDGRLRFQLASRLAGRFDEYQLYRPDLLLAWERDEQPLDDTPSRETAAWQSAIWKKVVADAGTNHLARRFVDLAAVLGRAESAPSGIPTRVSVFGAASLPPIFLELLGGLSRFARVALYVVSPTKEYWSDLRSERAAAEQLDFFAKRGITATDAHVEVGNAVLTSLGRQGQELDSLLQALDVDGSAREHLDSPVPSRKTVLGALQADIVELVDRGHADGRQPPIALSEGDRSLSIHVCHSPMREMQVLRDLILDAFATDPTLRPDEIFVLAPDIGKYTPFIQAVFGVAHDGEPTLRFTIADRTARSEEPLVDAGFKLLDLVGSRITASSVLDLLDADAVRRAASIEASEIEIVRGWVTSTPIRWGIDGRHRRETLELPSEEIDAADTWRGGLDRLLLGYAIDDSSALIAGRLPSPLAAGEPSLLGRFIGFVDRLLAELERLTRPRTLVEWTRDLRISFTAMLKAADEVEDAALATLLDAADRLAGYQELSACNDAVTIETVRDALRTELPAGGGGGFINGAITFCSLQPMRAIPAKLVAMVGLDDGVFPRRYRPASFDLIAAAPRLGDRSTKEDDRYLFLETMLAARERLVLSYVGRSQKDNRELAPSSALVELAAAVDRSFVAAGGRSASAHLTTVHALQPFSPRYFVADDSDTRESRLPSSFSKASYDAAQALLSTPAGERAFIEDAIRETERPHEIDLADLTEFWVSPSKHFCTRTLGIRLPKDEAPASDAESFELEGLERYQVSQLLLERRLAGMSAGDDELGLLRAGGSLPHAGLSRAYYAILCSELDDLIATMESLLGSRPVAKPPLAIEVHGADWRLVGTVSSLTEHGQLRCRTAELKSKDHVRAWISHLALGAVEPQTTFVIGKSDTKDKKTKLAPYVGARFRPVPDATERLDRLVRGYLDGLAAPIPVFEKASYAYGKYAYARTLPKNRTTTEPYKAACEAFASRYKYKGDDVDPYVALCTRGRAPLEEDRARFEALASELWLPLLAAWEKVKT